MSLNGLDDPRVEEAYNAALAEPGAWFLLKYISRDQVEILTHGGGGAAEAKQAVADYAEISPLYGFMHYRRRKVIMKYIPEGVSRLLQARVSVHFQSITDRFTPHDTIFTFSSPEQLKDSALSAACSLHTASGSAASSNASSVKQKLVGITEGTEDGQFLDSESRNHHVHSREEPVEPSVDVERPSSPEEASSGWTHGEISVEKPSERIKTPTSSSSMDFASSPSGSGTGHSNRAVSYDTYGFGPYNHKPKVKLGPRPSLDNGKRPHANALHSGESSHPVATLPAGLRAATRSTAPVRPPSQNSQMSSISIFPTPPTQSNSQRLQTVASRPSSSGTVSSMTSVRPVSAKSSKSSSLTYEKQRLQKALELRRQNLKSKTELVPAHAAPDTPSSSYSSEDSEMTQQKQVSHSLKETLENKAEYIDGDVLTSTSDAQEALPTAPPPSQSASDPFPRTTSDSSLHETTSTKPVLDSAINLPQPFYSPSPQFSADDIKKINSADDRESNKENQSPASEKEDGEAKFGTGHHQRHQEDSRTGVAGLPRKQTNELQSCSQSLASLTSLDPPADAFSSPAKSEQDQGEKYLSPQPRGPAFDSIRIELAAENAEDQYLSDDSFLEELHRAKVEEARPVSVAKSPIEPYFPVGLSDPYSDRYTPVSRAVSNPFNGQNITSPRRLSPSSPFPDQPRSLSASYAENNGIQPAPAPVAKRVNVSSGISKRIKALEMLSGRESSNTPPSNSRASTPDSTSSLSTLRKPSVRHTYLRPGSAFAPDRDSSRDTSPISATPSSRDQEGVRRLVRNNSQGNVKRHSVLSLSTSRTGIEAKLRDNSQSDKSLSGENLTIATDVNPSNNPSSEQPVSSRRQSIKSRTSTSSRRGSEPRSPTFNSADSLNEKEEKKSSRASRILRRMSALSSPSKKSSAPPSNPTVKEEPVQDKSSQKPLSNAVQDVGEVNVQFPDTLLWKRRCLKIDGQGFLSLAVAKADENARAFTKRYHLSEFYEPAIPDLDRQELPHSVILDFKDGSTLQCACENSIGQAQLLQVLKESYRSCHPLT